MKVYVHLLTLHQDRRSVIRIRLIAGHACTVPRFNNVIGFAA